MNKKLLIEIIVVLGIAWATLALLPFSIAVWIYLVWMVWKKKANIFHDQMEPKLAERRLKRLRASLLVAGTSLTACIVTVLVQVVVLIGIFGQPEEEGPVVFFIAFFSAVLFAIATSGSLVTFLKGRRKPT
ncbi:hypothetical protein ACFLW4_06830 [Chloroflexota bacterium]